MSTDNTLQMLQAILKGQSALKQELSVKIDGVEKKVDKLAVDLGERIDKVEKNLTARIDKLGKQLAYLEDDAPTREEFDKLEKRVDTLVYKS